VSALNEELGVHPAKQTVAVYDQIRADCLDCVPIGGSSKVLPKTASLPPSNSGRLEDLRRALAALHDQIGKALTVMEESIPHSD
jgi:hypothetical protein